MTVNMLIQIDKLVQLLESPVFTCKRFLVYRNVANLLRFENAIAGTGKIPTLV
jgi:hypothetical protein